MSQKEVRETLALAQAAGLRVERGSKHYKFFTEAGEMVLVVPFTSKDDRRRQQNARAAIRRAGRDAPERSTP